MSPETDFPAKNQKFVIIVMPKIALFIEVFVF